MQAWSIIILCYNEEGAIYETVKSVIQVLKKMHVVDYEIIIIDDGSRDKSRAIIESLKNNFKCVRVVRHSSNFGIGASLLSGYKCAKKENICALPGDGQFDIEELIPFKNVKDETFISFFRQEKTSYSFLRTSLSKINRLFNRLFLNIDLKDVNWVKIYKRKSLKVLELELTSSLVESEICAKLIKIGHMCVEVPSLYLPRKTGKSKGSSSKIVFQVLKEMIKLFFIVQSF